MSQFQTTVPSRVAALLLALLAWSYPVPAAAEEAPAGAIPLPVEKTTTLRGDGKVFVVDGHVVIPENVELGVEWGTSIVGINSAKLEVRGGLKVRGTVEHWVVIRNIDFSPTTNPKRGFHLDMVDFKACRFVHAQDKPFEGSLTIENSTFQTGSEFDFRIRKGKLSLFLTVWRPTCTVHLVPSEGEKPDIGVAIRSSEFRELLTVSGHGAIGLSHNALKKGVKCEHVLALGIDGCDIHDGLEIRQQAPDSFKKVKLTKCNIWNGAGVTLHRDAGEDQKREKVFLQKFYFGSFDGSEPYVDRKKIEDLVTLGPGNIKVKLDKPRKRKHQLVPYDPLMMRPPPLRE